MIVPVLQLRAENELREAFRALGAVTPATARPGKDLPPKTDPFNNLLRRGVIREGAPETFYLYQSEPVRGHMVRQVSFWIFIILIPVAIIQFCPGHH